jgi:hypothetical protein
MEADRLNTSRLPGIVEGFSQNLQTKRQLLQKMFPGLYLDWRIPTSDLFASAQFLQDMPDKEMGGVVELLLFGKTVRLLAANCLKRGDKGEQIRDQLEGLFQKVAKNHHRRISPLGFVLKQKPVSDLVFRLSGAQVYGTGFKDKTVGEYITKRFAWGLRPALAALILTEKEFEGNLYKKEEEKSTDHKGLEQAVDNLTVYFSRLRSLVLSLKPKTLLGKILLYYLTEAPLKKFGIPGGVGTVIPINQVGTNFEEYTHLYNWLKIPALEFGQDAQDTLSAFHESWHGAFFNNDIRTMMEALWCCRACRKPGFAEALTGLLMRSCWYENDEGRNGNSLYPTGAETWFKLLVLKEKPIKTKVHTYYGSDLYGREEVYPPSDWQPLSLKERKQIIDEVIVAMEPLSFQPRLKEIVDYLKYKREKMERKKK